MASIPEAISGDPTLNAIDAAIISMQDRDIRPYFGMSMAGHSCARRCWYQFRWCAKDNLSAQSIKAIDDGHRGELLQAERLRLVPGITLHTENDKGEQFTLNAIGHMKGHIDGAIIGLLQAKNTWHVWEHKQCNEKKCLLLAKLKHEYGEKNALERWDNVYFVQSQFYMRYTGMDRHYLTVATPGGRSTISCRTEYQPDKADYFEKRARMIIYSSEPPLRISDDPSWYECKYCPFYEVCHGQEAPLVTCRSCAHVTPDPQGGWKCERFGHWLTISAQKEACAQHRYIPALLSTFAVMVDADAGENWVEYRNLATNALFMNCGTVYRSADIHGCQDKSQLGVKEG